jgi:hypothetical protein
MANFPSSSFMNLFKNIVYDKSTNPNAILDIWDAYLISPFYKDELRHFQLHKVSIGETWVSLAKYYYDDERLWWLIPMFNNIIDPFIVMNQDLFVNEIVQLKILKAEHVGQLLLNARQIKIMNDHDFEKGEDN